MMWKLPGPFPFAIRFMAVSGSLPLGHLRRLQSGRTSPVALTAPQADSPRTVTVAAIENITIRKMSCLHTCTLLRRKRCASLIHIVWERHDRGHCISRTLSTFRKLLHKNPDGRCNSRLLEQRPFKLHSPAVRRSVNIGVSNRCGSSGQLSVAISGDVFLHRSGPHTVETCVNVGDPLQFHETAIIGTCRRCLCRARRVNNGHDEEYA